MTRTTRLLRTLAAACCLAALAVSPARGADWPQWRGPNRDGWVPEGSLADSLPQQLTRKWQVTVGTGHSSPVVVGERVYVFSRDDDLETVRCLSLDSGKELWNERYAAPYKVNNAARDHGKGPKSTPIAARGKLVTLGISGILSCWDTATGKQVWQRDFSDKFDQTSPLYGTAMSPLIDGSHVIAHVGGPDDGALAAFDLAGGQVRWSWEGDGPAYTSPIIATIEGVRQVITQSQESCLAVSAGGGELLWRIPFTTGYDQNAVTPVMAGKHPIFSGWHERTFAVRVVKGAAEFTTEELWSNQDVPMYMSSPVVVGPHLFGFTEKKRGQLFCLHTSSGKVSWTGPARMGENAAILTDGERLLVLTTDARLHVIRANADKYEPVTSYQVADTATWAHPALVEGKLLIKDAETLTLWSLAP